MTERESGFLCHEIRESYTYSKNPRKGRRKDCCAVASAADYRHESSLGPLCRRKRLWFACGQELSGRCLPCFPGGLLNRVLFKVAAHTSYIGKKQPVITHLEKIFGRILRSMKVRRTVKPTLRTQSGKLFFMTRKLFGQAEGRAENPILNLLGNPSMRSVAQKLPASPFVTSYCDY